MRTPCAHSTTTLGVCDASACAAAPWPAPVCTRTPCAHATTTLRVCDVLACAAAPWLRLHASVHTVLQAGVPSHPLLLRQRVLGMRQFYVTTQSGICAKPAQALLAVAGPDHNVCSMTGWQWITGRAHVHQATWARLSVQCASSATSWLPDRQAAMSHCAHTQHAQREKHGCAGAEKGSTLPFHGSVASSSYQAAFVTAHSSSEVAGRASLSTRGTALPPCSLRHRQPMIVRLSGRRGVMGITSKGKGNAPMRQLSHSVFWMRCSSCQKRNKRVSCADCDIQGRRRTDANQYACTGRVGLRTGTPGSSSEWTPPIE